MPVRIVRPDTAFASPSRQRRPRIRREPHLAYVRALPCAVCGAHGSTEAAHIRYGDRRGGKRETGMGEKPDDRFTVPLCAGHHRTLRDAQHNHRERAWWSRIGIDPVILALALFSVSGDVEAGCQIVRDHRLTATPRREDR